MHKNTVRKYVHINVNTLISYNNNSNTKTDELFEI